ncbi:hypothetical protein CWI38_0829p0020 [Hamiltosporidium tvaerminnensis]|uniref:Uncharacterized protein n=1 Tax=Hamiltosporidium tvaerminnensis TaxID=1176355 RepID=A0A4Q9LUC4_9MICR|nr:hypothetical protein CWI38_0829p0020 [Hamiltosporidium tvaerminnensis]
MKFLYAQACAFKLKESDFITTDVKNRILRIGNAYYITNYDKLLPQIRDNRLILEVLFNLFTIQVIHLQNIDRIRSEVENILSLVLNKLEKIVFFNLKLDNIFIDFINKHKLFRRTKALEFIACDFKDIVFIYLKKLKIYLGFHSLEF